LKNPIVTPQLCFFENRFTLTYEEWLSIEQVLISLGCQLLIESRQYLEDCELKRTDIIAIQGVILFKDVKSKFTAQLDSEGFALYVDSHIPKEFLAKLNEVYRL
jgi:hypothetical protein